MASQDEEEEDDYLSMTFADSTSASTKETSLQRTARLKREAAQRARVPSKAEVAEREKASREAALATQLDSQNKGARMMARMGFKGGALGAKGNEGRAEPISVELKDDRGGIGMDSERKRKVREAAETLEVGKKRAKVSEAEYRERTKSEREEKRVEGMWWGAMKVLEGFEEDEEVDEGVRAKDGNDAISRKTKAGKPVKSTNLLYRSLIRDRLEKEQERRARHDLVQSLSRSAAYDDPDADEDDKLALGNEIEDIDEGDVELEEFEALPVTEKLERVVAYLREKYNYCFWCKYRYPDKDMDGCPGLTEDEHG